MHYTGIIHETEDADRMEYYILHSQWIEWDRQLLYAIYRADEHPVNIIIDVFQNIINAVLTTYSYTKKKNENMLSLLQKDRRSHSYSYGKCSNIIAASSPHSKLLYLHHTSNHIFINNYTATTQPASASATHTAAVQQQMHACMPEPNRIR